MNRNLAAWALGYFPDSLNEPKSRVFPDCLDDLPVFDEADDSHDSSTLRAGQGIDLVSNWRGNSWNITYNEVIGLRTNCGGGIGIIIGDYLEGIVSDNIIAHNKIQGLLQVAADDCGGDNGSSIVLYP